LSVGDYKGLDGYESSNIGADLSKDSVLMKEMVVLLHRWQMV